MIDFSICGGIFDLASKEARVKELESKMEEAHFWDDNEKAQKVIAECKALRLWTAPYEEINKRFQDVKELLPEADKVEDRELVAELIDELGKIEKDLSVLEIRKMLSGDLDNKNCYLSINAGAGGTESCDWALMLSRMYQRWAAKRGWQAELYRYCRWRCGWD